MHHLFLVFAICLNLTFSAVAAGPSDIWHEKALEIQKETQTQVDKEMSILFERWAQLAPKTAAEVKKIKTQVESSIMEDKQSVARLLTEISALPPAEKEEVGLDLSSNGQKFSGTFADHILAKIDGAYLPIIQGKKINLSREQLTEVKMLLLYLIGIEERVTDVAKTSVFKQIMFLYGYELESFIPVYSIENHFLFNNGVFYMPNSGYVFGGTLRQGVNRGMDCSAYISVVLGAQYRPSSLLLEVLWNHQMNVPMPYFDANPEKLQDLIDNWNLMELEEEFQAIRVGTSADLQAGDVIVWRTSASDQPDIFAKSGHVLMVLDPGPGSNKFLGIDLRRDDDQEGHYQDVYQLFLPGKDTFVVRKRTP